MEHELKTWPKYFQAVIDGRKTFELRVADRRFEVWDTLLLREWCPSKLDYTGRRARVVVSYLTSGPWLAEGFTAMATTLTSSQPAQEGGKDG